MKDKTKNKLILLLEVCGKLSQYCSKSIRYGLFSHHPNKSKTNGDEILITYYRLQSIIETLQNERILPVYSKDYIEHIKRDTIGSIKVHKHTSRGKRL